MGVVPRSSWDVLLYETGNGRKEERSLEEREGGNKKLLQELPMQNHEQKCIKNNAIEHKSSIYMQHITKPHSNHAHTTSTHSLPGASLCTGHEVMPTHTNGNGVLLYRSGTLVFTLFNVLLCCIKEPTLLKRVNMSRGVPSSYFYRDLIVSVKVDTGTDCLI